MDSPFSIDGSLFIYGDDSEYTRRVSGKHKLYLIRDAVIDHQDAPVLDANMTRPSDTKTIEKLTALLSDR